MRSLLCTQGDQATQNAVSDTQNTVQLGRELSDRW